MSKRTLRSTFGGGQAAFTLLEIMLAVGMLALVVTAVYGTWNVALKAWKRGADVAATFQRQRIVLDTLCELANSLTFFSSPDGLYTVTGDHSENGADSVSFVTASDVLLPQSESLASGMRRVTISLQHDPQTGTFLGLVNEPALGAQNDAANETLHVLSMDVTGFYVRYRNPTDGVWKDEWQERGIVPSAIEFTLVFGGRDGRTPPVVVTRAVELPAAMGAMGPTGLPAGAQQNSTNEVRLRDDIDVGSLLKQQSQGPSGGGGEN